MADPIFNISSVDGRYAKKTQELQKYFSEAALIYFRFYMEMKYLIFLGKKKVVTIDSTTISSLEKILKEHPHTHDVMEKIALRVKEIESVTNHDVKAVEYFVKELLTANGFESLKEHVHIGLTSEDVTSNALALGMAKFLNEIALPEIRLVIDHLETKSKEYSKVVMMSMTHGQPATPTTYGKELRIYAERYKDLLSELGALVCTGKLNGAAGNYNAHMLINSEIDWCGFSSEFIKEFLVHGFVKGPVKLKCAMYTNQIDPHLSQAKIFQKLALILTVNRNMAVDHWLYISRNILKLKVKNTEVGSSAMPHKVNPIDLKIVKATLLWPHLHLIS